MSCASTLVPSVHGLHASPSILIASVLNGHSGLVSTKVELSPPMFLGSVLASGIDDHRSHHFLWAQSPNHLNFLYLNPVFFMENGSYNTSISLLVQCLIVPHWAMYFTTCRGCEGALWGCLGWPIVFSCPKPCQRHPFPNAVLPWIVYIFPNLQTKELGALKPRIRILLSKSLLSLILVSFLDSYFWPPRAFPVLWDQKFLWIHNLTFPTLSLPLWSTHQALVPEM